MPSQEFLHFKPGETFFEGAPDNANDGDRILGEEVQYRHSTGRMRTLRVVRNSSGIALSAKRLAVLNATRTEITGYTRLPSDVGFPIDDQLSSTVAANDICFVCVEGPSLVLTGLDNVSADIAAGDYLTAVTAATSQATTGGRLVLRVLTSNVTAAVTYNDGVFGRAISTALTSDTNSDVLVDVKHSVSW